MKNSRSNLLRCASIAAPLIIALAPNAHAQLTWDPNFTEGTALGGSGFWETPNTNWWNGAINTTWDNTGATTAIFPDFEGNQIIELTTGLIVGDLEYQDDQIMQFRGTEDNQVLAIKSGGATWDTGGGQIEFLNNTALDVALTMTSGDTLTINGGGEFDTGEKPTGATWGVAGSTLDITAPTILRGQAGSVGQFALVKIPGDSTFVQERNANQDINTNWEVTDAGNLTVGNRWGGRSVFMNGAISGTGGLTFRGLNSALGGESGFARLNNTGNTFEGGIVVDGSVNSTLLRVAGADDAVLGAVPASFESDNITLKDGGKLRFDGAFTVNANRGVTLENGGVIILSGAASSLEGPITGTGGLTIGVAEDGSSNTLTLLSDASDYLDGTNIVRGSITAGIANSLPTDSVLSLLANNGGTTAFFNLNGFDTTVGGLVTTAGSGTREIRNGGADATLTIDVATGEEYSYSGNLNTAGTVSFIKEGPGIQTINRTGGYTNDPGNLTVNDGELIWNVSSSWGDTSVANGSTFTLNRTGTTASFTAASGSTTNYEVGIGDWTGVAGTDWPLLTVTGDLDIPTGSTFTVKVTDGSITNFTDTTKSFVIASIGGTITSLDGTITVDSSGFASGTGTWSLAPDGQDLVLTYTSTADPYGSWAATNITDIEPTAPAGFDDDADNDGVTNGLEFVLSGNPLTPNSAVLPTISLDATNLTFSYTRSVDSKTSTTQIVQWSPDLNTWTDISVLSGDPDAVDIVIPRSNEVDGKLFTRLKVTNP